MLRNPRIVLGTVVLVLVLGAALSAPAIAPHDYAKMHTGQYMKTSSATFILGTDRFGRDIFSRLLFGARVSMLVAVASVLASSLVGTALGLVAGYYGGLVDTLIMRTMDVFLSFPPILLAIALIAFLGSNLRNLILVIAILYTPRIGRIVYASTLSVKQMDYVLSARAIGSRAPRVILRYVLPNLMAPLLIQMSLSLGFAVLLESGLSFLGLGPPPPQPSWGSMISESRDFMEMAPHLVIWPSLVLALAILSFNTLSEGLRDVLDPRLRGR
jgi:peptide/nickel transport system permease protein